MKIGFDAKRFFHNTSGLGNYSRDLIRILAHLVPQNQYLLFDKKESERGSDILTLENVAFRQTSKGLLARQLNQGQDAQSEGCEIFHGLSGELPLKWNESPIKKVLTIHDLIFEIYPKYYSFLDRKIHLWKFKKAANEADIIVAISEQTKQDIIRFLKIPSQKIKVIYQGCSNVYKQEYSEERKNSVREKYDLPEKFILNVGTIEERKNGLSLVNAIIDTDFPLVFIGRDTDYTLKIKSCISANGLDMQVSFLKGVSNEDLAIIYQLSTVFAYPSVYEGFGIPIIEALFSGTPVITNKDGVFNEAGGPDSMYVNIEDPLEIRQKIELLWNDAKLRQEVVTKGKLFAQKFKDEEIAKQWQELYLSL